MTKNTSYEPSRELRAVATPTSWQNNVNGTGLLLRKRKDRGAQWIDRCTIHAGFREMNLGERCETYL